MKTRYVVVALLLCTTLIPTSAKAQNGLSDVFNKFKLEARADAEVEKMDTQAADYGVHGRYFNLMVGGDLGKGFSYYFRQRIKAEEGSIHFFDNTDFLWVNYQVNDRFRLRFGKDAMAVGGYEYDAAPIDEYLVSEYWNNFYCFQLGFSAAYTLAEGQTVVAQVTQSPYINSRRDLGESVNWNAGLLSYNVEWIGHIGPHINTLWSTSLIERKRGTFMNLTMLGTQYVSDRFSAYLDLMHHSLATDDWGKNYGAVCRVDYHLNPQWTLLLKGSYEQNRSKEDVESSGVLDPLVLAGHRYWKFGAGFEYRPIESVRLHAYLAESADEHIDVSMHHSLLLNVGATWTMDFKKLFK